MRDTSKTLMPMERGSRVDIENKKIRLFLHWVENTRNTDLDLSIVLYDEDFYEEIKCPDCMKFVPAVRKSGRM